MTYITPFEFDHAENRRLKRRGSARLPAVRNESREEAASAAVDNFADRIFFVTTVTWGRRPLFQSESAAKLLLETVFSYRERGIFQLYEFVIMPDHVHLLLAPTPNLALERAMQFIKGGYSHRFSKETSSRMESGNAVLRIIEFGTLRISKSTGAIFI